jgi:hypothetical protein
MSSITYTDASIVKLIHHAPNGVGGENKTSLLDAFFSTFDWEFIVTMDLLLFGAVTTAAGDKIDPVGTLPERLVDSLLELNFSASDVDFMSAVRKFLGTNRYPGDRIVSALLKNPANRKYDQISINRALRYDAFKHHRQMDRMESTHLPFHNPPEG